MADYSTPECDLTAIVPRIVKPIPTFFPNYFDIAALLTNFLRKKQPEDLPILNDHESKAIDKLIRKISSKPVLALPRPDLPFVIDADVSDYQVGTALFSVYPDGERKPIEIGPGHSTHTKKNTPFRKKIA